MMGNYCLAAFVLCVIGEGFSEQNTPIDVVILLDSSDNFRSQNFVEEKRFSTAIVRELWGDNNRMSFYTFGSHTHLHFSLNTYYQLSDIIQSIQYMWYSTGNGKLEDAIAKTINEGFSELAGNRDCTPNVLVVLTHTSLTNATAAVEIREKLKNKSINIVIIDMVSGQGHVDHGFLEITGNLSRILPCQSFAALQELPQKLRHHINANHYPTGCGLLSDWNSWTSCSVTCGTGQRFRTRSCNKDKETDKDCYGERSQDEACSRSVCKVLLNGGWSNWGQWTTCTKTCNRGIQIRQRLCNEPIPAYGGKDCPGANNQSRECASWKCPDCNKSCPPGGKLSNCEVCLCSNIALFGRVMDNLNSPVKEAGVFLESMLYNPLAKTDDWGYFNVSDTCIMNETVVIIKDGYADGTVELAEVNRTHWWANASVTKYVSPMFNITPESKVRMVGQSASLCCSAVGTPTPSAVIWYKDGIEIEHLGTDGTLSLTSLKTNDSGRYWCSAETEAGVTQSDEAILTIKGTGTDTCLEPVSKLETLPSTCFATGDNTKNSTLDVKACNKEKCISSLQTDNGTCSDWWAHHCCDVDETELVNISCDGFNYQIARVKTCKCQLCVSKTTISGRAFGRANGSVVPLQLGSISANGKTVSSTTMSGYFRFDVQKNAKRIILHFHDGVFKKLLDHTKIVLPQEGGDTQLSVAIPLKPKPISFNPNLGADIQLGGNNGLHPASSISIPDNSLMTDDGQPFTGQAKAAIHFMDPRSRDDMETANGEFVYETQNGDKLPLQTFGMFHLTLEDHNGNALKSNKPFQFSLDSSLFNITLDKDGNPDLAMWYYDVNKGIWVEQGKMKFASAVSGRRKLLDSVLVAEFTPVEIPHMDPYSYHTERRIIGYTNCDKSVPIYENVQVRDPTPKNGVCYVSVSVYKDFTLQETAETGSVRVTAYSQELDESAYLGTETRSVGQFGHICLMVFCDKFIYLSAEKDGVKLLPAKHSLPDIYPIHNSSKHEVKFESRDFGDAYACKDGSVCRGPMFPFANGGQSTCQSSHSDSSFRFNFAPFTKEPSMSLTVGSKNIYDKKLSWYPVSPDKNTFRSCFIKVQVKVDGAFDIRVIAKSHLGSILGDEFGTQNVGPVPSPKSETWTNRAACLEFRCAGFVKDGPKEVYDLPTVVTGRLMTSDNTLKCTMSTNQGLNITKSADEKGFIFTAEAGRNYGPMFGVFINDADASQVKDFCYSGVDSGPDVDGLMNPDKNPAIVYTCR